MGLTLEAKKARVAEFGDYVARAQAMVLAEYRGMSVSDMTALRVKAREAGVHLRVLKNTLGRRAVAGTPFEKLADQMSGPLAYGLSKDPVAVARVMHEFARDNDKLVIKGGAIPNSLMTPRQVAQLATMPSREQLLAQLMGTMRAPVGKFVSTLNEVPSKFVRTLVALRAKKEGTPA